MRDAGFHSANEITEEIKSVKSNIENIQETQKHVLNAIEDNQIMMSYVANHMDQKSSDYKFNSNEYNDENTPPIDHQANAVSTAQNEVTKMLGTLTREIENIKAAIGNAQQPQPFQYPQSVFQPYFPTNVPPFQQGRGRGGRGGRGRGRGGRGRGRGNGHNGGRGRSNFQRQDTSKYCWTHGACGHPSWFCNNPKEGHQYQATFENKLGGSTYYCPPCPP